MNPMRTLFDNLFSVVAGAREQLGEKLLTGFYGVKGSQANGALLIVGRAVNGWMEDGWRAEELMIPERRRNIDDALFSASCGTERCPMTWVSELWSQPDAHYNTARSAFWRVARSVTHDLEIADTGSPGWPSYLMWTNLYKIASHDGGNPTGHLIAVQHDTCCKILAQEISCWKPRRILFLTGLDWASPFVESLGRMHDPQHEDGLVECSGNLVDVPGRPAFVVARHPQGKQESDLINTVVKCFRRLEPS